MPLVDIPAPVVGRNSPEGTIYYIGSVETLRVKIGYTRGCPFKRLRDLQTGSPCELTLMVAHPGTFAEEKMIHREFSRFSVRGEWFELSPELFFHIFTAVIGLANEYDEAGEAMPDWVKHRYSTLINSIAGTVQ